MPFNYIVFLNSIEEISETKNTYISKVNKLLVLSYDKNYTIFYEDYPGLCKYILNSILTIDKNEYIKELGKNQLILLFLTIINNLNYFELNCRYLAKQDLLFGILNKVLIIKDINIIQLTLDIVLSLCPYIEINDNNDNNSINIIYR